MDKGLPGVFQLLDEPNLRGEAERKKESAAGMYSMSKTPFVPRTGEIAELLMTSLSAEQLSSSQEVSRAHCQLGSWVRTAWEPSREGGVGL